MYIIERLDNGIRVVMEKLNHVNSATIGVLIDSGSVNEKSINNGVSHFIEHMVFKGTSNRSARQIAESIDDIGGQLNAFTGKEQTCFFAKVIDENLPIAIEVLSDMLNNSLFLVDDIQREKGVIIEEINMYQDSPEDLAFELLNTIMFEGTSLELPILGTINSVSNMDKEIILEYFNDNYNPENIIISIAGNFDTSKILRNLNIYFGKMKSTDRKKNYQVDSEYVFTNKIRGINKNIEQLNLCIGMEGIKTESDDIHPILLFNNIFGGSMSSRLFQRIREDSGLVYAIDSHLATYKKTGVFTIYAGLNPIHLLKVAEMINEEINNIRKNLITKEELRKSKDQFNGNFILSMEGTFNRMYEMAKSMSIFNRIETPDEILDKVEKVNLDDIERVVNHIFNKSKINIAYVGELDKPELYERRLGEILF